MTKVIKCPDCDSTDTEYADYQLTRYKFTVLEDEAQSAADFRKIKWGECEPDRLDGEMNEHFMCLNCFATVDCNMPEAEKWKAVAA